MAMRRATRALRIAVLLLAIHGFAATARSAGTERVLNLMSWSEYFPAPLLRRFERETGIHVNYTTMDSNDVMETTLSAGHSGFDLVTVNASPHLAREIPKHLWQPLDKTKIRTLGNADPSVMRALRRVDPENRYAVPWMWGTVGVLYNPDLVGRIDREAVPMIDRIFRPALVDRYRDCGVLLLDSWVDVLPVLSDWLGQPDFSAEPAALAAVSRAFRAIRPSIRRVNTSGYYQQLAEGEACLALGYSGDAQIARRIAKEAGKGVRIEFAVPTGRVPIFVDSFAIPADAPHVANAHAFIEFAMRPENAAEVAAYIGFATGNVAAIALLPAEARDNAAIYPPAEVRARFTLGRAFTVAEERTFGRAWLRMKSGH
jgi:putrescine transport system substrate-binding protein